jgi:hypothetical protein
MSVDITKVTSLCDKIDTAAAGVEDENTKTIFKDISAAIRLLNGNHEVIVKSQLNKGNNTSLVSAGSGSGFGTVSSMVSLGTIPKRNRLQSVGPVPAQEKNPAPVPASGSLSGQTNHREELPPELKKFKDAVQRAENSTLIFNLDLGRIPIMNTETMSTRATLALTAMAAEVENRRGSVPCDETVSTIDDILSMAKDIEFFGKKTKSYVNSKDSKSGSYCTVPVKYEFDDKEVRFEAEKFLRTKCGAHCATPYPIILRECIRQVSEKVKADYPDNQVKVQVDPYRFCLKVARRFVKEGVEKNTVKWESYEKVIPLPPEALDVEARRVPDGFRVKFLPPHRDGGMRGSPVRIRGGSDSQDSMDVTAPNSPQRESDSTPAASGAALEF